ncbi:DUF3306 domain-containing protein [Salaquimonas pukyongi]|uniref:DUF3306 domain-containing protein n=1 Tax=Salaquimonas pukyongi TaxID=2712698 RepID=UPI00096BB241|nr:DUF3306 domain-containing protein [Salaquimonas pukyongi]
MSRPGKTGSDFWSRRKAAVRKAEKEEKQSIEAEAGAKRQTQTEEKSEAQILEELGLPNPDELEKGDDFSAFLATAVPQRLRRRALRRLWAVNPTLANLDGLIDYGEDYTDKANVIDNLQTTYQVGKGMLEHVMKLAEEKRAEETDEEGDGSKENMVQQSTPDAAESPGKETGNDLLTGSDLPLQTESGENVAPAKEQARSAAGEKDSEERVNPRRRMRFTYS